MCGTSLQMAPSSLVVIESNNFGAARQSVRRLYLEEVSMASSCLEHSRVRRSRPPPASNLRYGIRLIIIGQHTRWFAPTVDLNRTEPATLAAKITVRSTRYLGIARKEARVRTPRGQHMRSKRPFRARMDIQNCRHTQLVLQSMRRLRAPKR